MCRLLETDHFRNRDALGAFTRCNAGANRSIQKMRVRIVFFRKRMIFFSPKLSSACTTLLQAPRTLHFRYRYASLDC